MVLLVLEQLWCVFQGSSQEAFVGFQGEIESIRHWTVQCVHVFLTTVDWNVVVHCPACTFSSALDWLVLIFLLIVHRVAIHIRVF